jgi:hypothetical protein
MEISGNTNDLKALLFFDLLAVIAQVFLLFILSWNIVAVIACVVITIFLLIDGYINWTYLNRKILLDATGCTFVSSKTANRFTWDEMYLQHSANSSYLFGDSEIPGEGIILSAHPIHKPTAIGAMTYCRFTHPGTSVFIRFSSPLDASPKNAAKFVYGGFVTDKDAFQYLPKGDRT